MGPYTEERQRARLDRTSVWLAEWEENLKDRQAALERTEAPNALVKPRRTGVSENVGPNVRGSDQICSSDYAELLTKGGETAASFAARERRLAAKVAELEERESAVGAREAATFEADLRNEACERYLQDVAEAQEKAERALEERLQDATSQLERLEEEAAEARRESVTARKEVEVVKREAGESIHRSEDRAAVRASEADAVREESSALRTTVFQQIAAREAEVRQAQERIAEAERQRASAQTEARAASELLERLRSDFEERVQLAVAQEIQRSTEQRNGLERPHRERHSNPPEVPVLDVSRHTRVPQITKARPPTPASTSSGLRGLPGSQMLLVSHDGADVRNEAQGGCSDAQGETQASGSRFVERIQTLSPMRPSHVASEGTCFTQTHHFPRQLYHENQCRPPCSGGTFGGNMSGSLFGTGMPAASSGWLPGLPDGSGIPPSRARGGLLGFVHSQWDGIQHGLRCGRRASNRF